MKRPFHHQFKIFALVALVFTVATGCKKTDGNLATVITSPITDKTINSAMGGGDVTDDGGTIVTARGVCWSIYETPTTADAKSIDGQGTGTFTSQLTNLSPEEVYFVRAYATNAAGTAYGSGISFTTAVADSGRAVFIDTRDGHEYRTQIIGTQTWMAENLAWLPSVSGPEAGSESIPFYYVYACDSGITLNAAKDSANYKIYGVLYNWPAAMVSCPAGWHLPTNDEWNLLVKTVGTPEGGKLKETGFTHWISENMGATNSSGFSAIPGGERYSLGEYRYIGKYAVFWSSSFRNDATSWSWHLYNNKNTISRDYFSKSNGFSVRCLKN